MKKKLLFALKFFILTVAVLAILYQVFVFAFVQIKTIQYLEREKTLDGTFYYYTDYTDYVPEKGSPSKIIYEQKIGKTPYKLFSADNSLKARLVKSKQLLILGIDRKGISKFDLKYQLQDYIYPSENLVFFYSALSEDEKYLAVGFTELAVQKILLIDLDNFSTKIIFEDPPEGRKYASVTLQPLSFSKDNSDLFFTRVFPEGRNFNYFKLDVKTGKEGDVMMPFGEFTADGTKNAYFTDLVGPYQCTPGRSYRLGYFETSTLKDTLIFSEPNIQLNTHGWDPTGSKFLFTKRKFIPTPCGPDHTFDGFQDEQVFIYDTTTHEITKAASIDEIKTNWYPNDYPFTKTISDGEYLGHVQFEKIEGLNIKTPLDYWPLIIFKDWLLNI